MDCVRAASTRRDALIIDFFAGSGTTLHAVSLLNALDSGDRRCVLVTNNEVGPDDERKLIARGKRPGDREFEALGIFEQVTLPRCESAITGRRPDGTPVEGTYLDGAAFADGLNENVEFFRL